MDSSYTSERLVELRREFHAHPEPAWCEFYTTSRILEEIETIGVDAVYAGTDAHAMEHRMSVPDDATVDRWYERAGAEGAPNRHLESLQGSPTGAVAELRLGDDPVVGLWTDVDGLPQHESTSDDHIPAAEGFRSKHDGMMHACGHDAHAAIGLGVLAAAKESAFDGTLRVFFEPAEESAAGGKPMAKSGLLDDVDYLLAMHIGLDHPTGEVVASLDGFLAVTEFEASFDGAPSHAGAKPNEGRNAIQAAATAVGNLAGIARHADGASRVNTGVIGGGTASNVVPESAFLEGEIRGETTEIKEFLDERARMVLRTAAEMYDCEVEVTVEGEAPSADSDTGLSNLFAETARDCEAVDSVVDSDWVGASTDATYFMHEVQAAGGLAAYVGIGSDHPTGHHTATFDVDEDCLPIAVETLTGTIERTGELVGGDGEK